jgi:hypothetical protein
MHDAPDCVRLPLNQQVHVIGHEAVSVEKEWKSLLLSLEERKELLIISRIVEDSLPIITPRDYMIEAPSSSRRVGLAIARGFYFCLLRLSIPNESQNRRPDPFFFLWLLVRETCESGRANI